MLAKRSLRRVFILTIVCSVGVLERSEAQTFDSTFPILPLVRNLTLQQGGRLTPKQLIERYNYPYEEHKVVTEDGYILTVHRIPYGKDGPSANRMPIFVQHGLLSSSADWVVTGPISGVGFILADAGFDVWLGNSRGNTYSRTHTTLNPDSPADKPIYWRFTFHEMGKYDLPAVIDYILLNTSYSQLVYVGHSMGTSMFYVMASIRPEYNAKVKAFFSCGTCVYLQHMTSPARSVLTTAYAIRDTFDVLGIYELFSQNDTNNLGFDVWCANYSPLALFCATVLQALAGFDYGNYNQTAQTDILQNAPAGTATYTIFHLAQNTFYGLPFMPYIYSVLGNIVEPIPQPYPLSNVVVPVYMHICTNDSLTTPTDALRVANVLPNLVEVVTTQGCNHIDYPWGKSTREMWLDHIISVIYTLP